jgi:hypothetical protein
MFTLNFSKLYSLSAKASVPQHDIVLAASEAIHLHSAALPQFGEQRGGLVCTPSELTLA